MIQARQWVTHHWIGFAISGLLSVLASGGHYPCKVAAAQPSAPQTVSLGNVEMSVAVDRQTILVAQPFDVELQVLAPRGTRVRFPEIGQSLGSLLVLESRRRDPLPMDDQPHRRRWLYSIRVEAIEAGQTQVPSLNVEIELPGNDTSTSAKKTIRLQSEPVPIAISSVLSQEDDPQRFRDIKDVAALPKAVEPPSRLVWMLVAVAAAGLATVALLAAKRRRAGPEPEQWALDQVDQIEGLYSKSMMNFTDAIGQLSSVLREFLELRYGLPAISRSSEEIAGELARCESIDQSRARLAAQFMLEADQLKFAGHIRGAQQSPPFHVIRQIVSGSPAVDRGAV